MAVLVGTWAPGCSNFVLSAKPPLESTSCSVAAMLTGQDYGEVCTLQERIDFIFLEQVARKIEVEEKNSFCMMFTDMSGLGEGSV